MRIGIAFDLAPGPAPADGPDDLFEEFDKPETIDALRRVLEARGHGVELLGDGRSFLARMLNDPPELVWNLAEGEGTSRSREARVPAVCEMLGVPHTGSDPLTLAVTLDKPIAKRLVSHVVAVPEGCLVTRDDTLEAASARIAPLQTGPGSLWIVKPALEGSSKGIREASVFDDPTRAATNALSLARDYRQPILVESYIEGDEVTVGLLGNDPRVELLGMMRIRPRQHLPRFVYSIESKRDWDARIEYETPARLDPATTERVTRAALAAYAALGCRDVARIDFRVKQGVPYFLEANPLPGLAPDWSDLTILARGCGVDYETLIGKILDAALDRIQRARGSGR